MAYSSWPRIRFRIGLVIAAVLHAQRLKDQGLHQLWKRGLCGIDEELLEHGVVAARVAELTARHKRDAYGWRIGRWVALEHLQQRWRGGAAAETAIPILCQSGGVPE